MVASVIDVAPDHDDGYDMGDVLMDYGAELARQIAGALIVKAERVGEFQQALVERLHADAADTLKKIAEGDWSDETQEALRSSI